ncbi:MAG TPA: hypothetical protein VF343_07335 [Syntrophales bacterium]
MKAEPECRPLRGSDQWKREEGTRDKGVGTSKKWIKNLKPHGEAVVVPAC